MNHTKLLIDQLAYGGIGLTKSDGKTYLIEGDVVPGDLIQLSIEQEKNDLVRGRVLEILKPSPNRIPSICTHFPACGGCDYLSMPHDIQLSIKRKILRETLERIGKFSYQRIQVLPVTANIHYRNKMVFHLTKDESGYHLGLFPKKSDIAIPIDLCHLEHRLSKKIRNWMEERCNQEKTMPFGGFQQATPLLEKWLSELSIRISFSAKKALVCFGIINTYAKNKKVIQTLQTWTQEMVHAIPEVASIYYTIIAESPTTHGIDTATEVNSAHNKKNNPANTNVDKDTHQDQATLLHGDASIYETFDHPAKPLKFGIGPHGFSQVNPLQMPVLYNTIYDSIAQQKHNVVVDAYAGASTIACWIHNLVDTLYALELDPAALAQAKKNILVNQCLKIRVMPGDVRASLKKLVSSNTPIDCIILDPPRKGCAKTVLHSIGSSKANQVFYVSCDPATFSRDARHLEKEGYQLKEVYLVDMFPHTFHMEILGVFMIGNKAGT